MWQKNVHYLDYNAGAGLTLPVRKKLMGLLTGDSPEDGFFFANASSQHRLGQRVKQQIHQANLIIASSLNASPEDIVLTSSGTEANQTIIRSGLRDAQGMVIGSGEHSASFDFLAEASQIRPDLDFLHPLPLSSSGNHDYQALKILLESAKEKGLRKIFLSLFLANHETGVVNDLNRLSSILKSSPVEVILHLDAAQAWGKMPIDVSSTPAHYISFSAHKIGAPAGTGLIWIRPGCSFHPLFIGEQSKGRRAGTENVLGIVATAAAAESIHLENFKKRTGMLRDALEDELAQSGLGIRFWGQDCERVSNTSRFSFQGYSNYENWVELLDLKGFAVSHGSACQSRVVEPSRVLLQMGATRAEALNAIRVSFGPENTLEEVKGLVVALLQICSQKKRNEARP